MSKTALVTGGAGFIGSHLCDRLLVEGWSVRVLDDLSTGSRSNLASDVELFEGDVQSAEDCKNACAGVDTVFHLAAKVTIRNAAATFSEDASTNIMGTINMLSAAGGAGVSRFVNTSSMAVYADSLDFATVDEQHRIEPLTPYGISKHTAEQYALMMGPELGLEPVVLRLFNTFGTRQSFTPYVGVVTIFITKMLDGQPCTVFGDGDQCRDFVHVSDVARAFALAASCDDVSGKIFNVGTGVGTTVNQIVDLLRERLGEGQFGHEQAHPGELRHSVANIAHAERVLGYSAKESLGGRLDEVIDAIKELRER